jgi:hypothetical protein
VHDCELLIDQPLADWDDPLSPRGEEARNFYGGMDSEWAGPMIGEFPRSTAASMFGWRAGLLW